MKCQSADRKNSLPAAVLVNYSSRNEPSSGQISFIVAIPAQPD